ncbi:hypothetical protein P154DRAFT_205687 [Amniculicola lignicola CBS 123094]|uniref:Uncharacterized protein n=1 Tax=Amniculicola lignicola CBS 123094 TaxID=1392246 RepID=A0A6A5WDN7_9PLEO|nr:hypothetical protein P154DRAFT_205687 [Amniculicola lignicola CBS 123094]
MTAFAQWTLKGFRMDDSLVWQSGRLRLIRHHECAWVTMAVIAGGVFYSSNSIYPCPSIKYAFLLMQCTVYSPSQIFNHDPVRFLHHPFPWNYGSDC